MSTPHPDRGCLALLGTTPLCFLIRHRLPRRMGLRPGFDANPEGKIGRVDVALLVFTIIGSLAAIAAAMFSGRDLLETRRERRADAARHEAALRPRITVRPEAQPGQGPFAWLSNAGAAADPVYILMEFGEQFLLARVSVPAHLPSLAIGPRDWRFVERGTSGRFSPAVLFVLARDAEGGWWDQGRGVRVEGDPRDWITRELQAAHIDHLVMAVHVPGTPGTSVLDVLSRSSGFPEM
jgi:hypothetical protein